MLHHVDHRRQTPGMERSITEHAICDTAGPCPAAGHVLRPDGPPRRSVRPRLAHGKWMVYISRRRCDTDVNRNDPSVGAVGTQVRLSMHGRTQSDVLCAPGTCLPPQAGHRASGRGRVGRFCDAGVK